MFYSTSATKEGQRRRRANQHFCNARRSQSTAIASGAWVDVFARMMVSTVGRKKVGQVPKQRAEYSRSDVRQRGFIPQKRPLLEIGPNSGFGLKLLSGHAKLRSKEVYIF